MLLRGMRNKANVAKITSRWLNIVGICRRSERVYQNTVVQSEYFDQQNKQAS